MGKTGPIGETLEIIQEEVEKGVQAAAVQVTGKGQNQAKQAASAKQGTKPSDSPGQTPPTDQTNQFVADLYGAKASSISDAEIEQKELEDKQKKEELRQKLHKEFYFEPLVNPPKSKEERPAEKIERENKEEMVELEEKEKAKPKDLPIVSTKGMGTGERHRGVSG